MSKTNSYYANATRFIRDGIPCKVAPWVKDLSDRSRSEFLRGHGTDAIGTSAKTRQLSTLIRHPETTYLPA